MKNVIVASLTVFLSALATAHAVETVSPIPRIAPVAAIQRAFADSQAARSVAISFPDQRSAAAAVDAQMICSEMIGGMSILYRLAGTVQLCAKNSCARSYFLYDEEADEIRFAPEKDVMAACKSN